MWIWRAFVAIFFLLLFMQEPGKGPLLVEPVLIASILFLMDICWALLDKHRNKQALRESEEALAVYQEKIAEAKDSDTATIFDTERFWRQQKNSTEEYMQTLKKNPHAF